MRTISSKNWIFRWESASKNIIYLNIIFVIYIDIFFLYSRVCAYWSKRISDLYCLHKRNTEQPFVGASSCRHEKRSVFELNRVTLLITLTYVCVSKINTHTHTYIVYIYILNNIKHWHGNTNIPLYSDDIYTAKTLVYDGLTLFVILRPSTIVYGEIFKYLLFLFFHKFKWNCCNCIF